MESCVFFIDSHYMFVSSVIPHGKELFNFPFYNLTEVIFRKLSPYIAFNFHFLQHWRHLRHLRHHRNTKHQITKQRPTQSEPMACCSFPIQPLCRDLVAFLFININTQSPWLLRRGIRIDAQSEPMTSCSFPTTPSS